MDINGCGCTVDDVNWHRPNTISTRTWKQHFLGTLERTPWEPGRGKSTRFGELILQINHETPQGLKVAKLYETRPINFAEVCIGAVFGSRTLLLPQDAKDCPVTWQKS